MLRVLKKTSFTLSWDIRATTTGKYQIRLKHNHCSNPRRQEGSLQKRKERKNIFEASCPPNNGVITFHSSYVHLDIPGIAIHGLVLLSSPTVSLPQAKGGSKCNSSLKKHILNSGLKVLPNF